MIDNYCEFIKNIYKDPLAKITGLTVGEFYALRDHLSTCDACSVLVDEINEKYKDVQPPKSEWDDAQYN